MKSGYGGGKIALPRPYATFGWAGNFILNKEKQPSISTSAVMRNKNFSITPIYLETEREKKEGQGHAQGKLVKWVWRKKENQ